MLGLEPVSLMIKKSRLRGLDMLNEKMIVTDWVKCCTTLDVERMRQRGCPSKTWCDFVLGITWKA